MSQPGNNQRDRDARSRRVLKDYTMATKDRLVWAQEALRKKLEEEEKEKEANNIAKLVKKIAQEREDAAEEAKHVAKRRKVGEADTTQQSLSRLARRFGSERKARLYGFE